MGVDVRGAMLRAPWWVLSLVTGSVFALGQLAFRLLKGDSPTTAIATAAVMGLVFGAVIGPLSRRTNLRYRAAMGDALPRAKESAARRAAMRGPAPHDPEVRRAALGVIAHQLETHRKYRWAVPMWLFLIVLNLWLAISDSPWWLLSVLFLGGFLALHLWTPGHLRRRQRLLEDAPTVPTA